MRFLIVDPITGEKENTVINFEGELSKHIPLDNIEEECFHDGVKVKTKELVVTNSSFVVLCAKSPAHGAIAAFIAKAAISAIISSILSFAVRAILGKKPKKPNIAPLSTRGGTSESPTYAFEGIQDTITAGSPIPFLLGKGRKGGQVISTRVELIGDGKQQKLYMLLCLGYGELDDTDGVSNVEINGTKISSILNATFDWRRGSASQTAISGFEHSVDQTYFDGRDFTASPIIYTTRSSIDKADLFVGALAGIFSNDSQGNMGENTTNYKIEYRRQTSAGEPWILYKNASISGRTTNQKFSIENITFSTRDIYEIRFTFISATNTNPSFAAWNVSVHNVVERINETRTYNGYALLGIGALSTADLNGKLPNATCIFKAKVNTPAGLVYTQNNAWCIREILSNSKWGLGHRLTSGIIDAMTNSWQDLADHCDNSVSGQSGNEARHLMSYSGDSKIKGWDLVNDLLAMVDSSLIFSSGKLKVVIDKTQTATQLYGEANTVKGSLVIAYGRSERKINTVNGRYFNEDEDFVADFVKVEDTTALLSESVKSVDLELVGVSRQSEAIRACSRYLKENIYRTKEYSWKSPVGSIVAEPGDLVKRQFFVSDFSKGYSGYVLDGNTKEVYLDKIVILSIGKTYEIFIKHKSKNTLVKEDIITPAGSCGKVVLLNALILSVEEGDLWIIGEKNIAIADVLLNVVSQADDGTFTLSGDNYNANIYTIDALPAKTIRNKTAVGDILPLPIENWTVRESVELLPDGTIGSFLEFDILPGMLKNAGKALGGSSSTIDLSINEPARLNFFMNATIQIINGAGSGQSRRITAYDGTTKRATVDSNWSVNPNTTSEYEINFVRSGEYFGAIVEFSSNQNDWFELGRIAGTAGALPIRGQGILVYLRLIPYTLTGKRNMIALLTRNITTLGSNTVPSNVINFSVVQVNDILLCSWSNIPDLDIDYYEIRQGAIWEASVFVGKSKQDFFETTEFTEGAKIYLAKAVDRTGNYSATAASFSITLVEPNEREVFSVINELATLLGTFDGLSIIDVGGSNGIGMAAKYKYDAGYFWDTVPQAVENWDGATLLVGTYITQVYDLGVIAFARILADIEFQDSSGVVLLVQEQHSDDNITYSSWRIIGAGDQKWRYAKLKITMTVVNDTDNPVINKFNVVVDALIRTYRGIGVSVPTGAGVGVTFSTSYLKTPAIHITERSQAPIVYSNTPSKTGFTLKHNGAGTSTVDWRSEGI